MNHLHIDEMLFGQKEPMPPEVAYAICQMLAFGWRNWVRERYGVTIQPSIAHGDEGYEVSFRSVSKDEKAAV